MISTASGSDAATPGMIATAAAAQRKRPNKPAFLLNTAREAPALLGRVGDVRALAAVVRALGDTRRFAAQIAEVIELGAAHLAAAHELDRVDHRRQQREHPLDALAVGNLADREALVDAVAGAADADALIGLDAGALAFDHLDVDDHGVARLEVRNILAGGEPVGLLLVEGLDEVHGKFS